MSSSATPPSQKTDAQWLTDNGFANLSELMAKYDCEKPYDMEEGKELLEVMRGLDQMQFEKDQLVSQAIVWHVNMCHLDYRELKDMQQMSTGMPDWRDLKLRDIPPCETCGWGVERRVVL